MSISPPASPAHHASARGEGTPWRRLYPDNSHWLQLPGARYHYLDTGSPISGRHHGDETLLLVHGNPTWSFHWRGLIAAQSPVRRCVAPDHLGCGLSDLQPRPQRLSDHIGNLVALVRALDLQNITLVAQDWGGAIGLGALLEDRARFQRIVLLNTGAFPPWYVPWRIRVCRWPGFGSLAVRGGNLFSRAALRMTLARKKALDPAVAAGYLAPYDNWRRRGAVHQFVLDIPVDPRHPTWQTLVKIDEQLPELTDLPKLLVWGMQDWCFTEACLDRFISYWPDADVHRIHDAGHWVVEDAPEEVAEQLADFLSRTTFTTC